VDKYLAQAGALTAANGAGLTTDNWTPLAIGDVASLAATYTVAADGSGTHTTVQAAIDAVPALSASTARVYINVKPGT
jgi:pectinesterase